MKRLLIFVLLSALIFAKDIPLSLNKNISRETTVFYRLPPKKEGLIGGAIGTKLSDIVIDDSGNVHMALKEYKDYRCGWTYIRYDKNGNKIFKKEIYITTYVTTLETALGSRILVNPDMTVLVFYPDSEFYTCWAKLDKRGNIIERNEPRWWRGDAGSPVYSAGQDSFHIIAFPISHWTTLIKQYDSIIGEFYLRVDPGLIAVYSYSNNFALREKRIVLKGRYLTLGVQGAVSLPDNRLLCYSKGWTYLMDSEGKCYDGDNFTWKELDKIYFAKIKIDTILERLAKEIPIPPNSNWRYRSKERWIRYVSSVMTSTWGIGFGLFPDNTIGLGLCHNGALYLVKYDLEGKIIQSKRGEGKISKIVEMDKERVLAFITQVRIPECFGRASGLDKTIFYWGFDDLGNFFLQIY